MTIVAVARKWGNSLGITLPSEVVEEQGIKEGDTLMLPVIIKRTDLSDVFGIAKKKESSQKFKDMVREGWEG